LAYDVITFLPCHALGIEQIKASAIKYTVDTVALGASQSFFAALTTPAPVSRMQRLNCFEDKQTLVTFAKVFNLCIGAIDHSLARRSNCIALQDSKKNQANIRKVMARRLPANIMVFLGFCHAMT